MRTLAATMLIFLGTAGGLGAGEVVELDAASLARAGVVTRPVLERTFGERVRVVGQVVRSPGSTLTVKTVVPGRVEEIGARPGERVAAGALLAELHSHDLLVMQQRLLTARERARMAEIRLEAGRELYAIEGISRLDLEARQQEALTARLESEGLHEELVDHGMPPDRLEQVLASGRTDPHLPVRAPVAGVVLALEIELHEWVREYDPLFVIGDPERVELVLQIPPDEATLVSAGDVVEFVAVGRVTAAGRAEVITRVPEVDPVTRTVAVRARIVGDQPGFFPGVFVEGTVSHGEVRTAPAVPEAAVIRLGGSDVVFVRRSATGFEARPVVLGESDGTGWEIIEGVAPGEEVVVQGVFLLKSALIGGEE